MRSRALALAFVVGVGLLGGLAVGCGEQDGDGGGVVGVRNDALVAAGRARATRAVFGEGADPATVVATVGASSVTTGEVAVYLELYPTLTTEQAVQDLVDIRAVATGAEDIPAPDLRLAQLRGRTMAWMRAYVWDAEHLQTPDPARVEELLTETRHITTFGTPELAVATHVLFATENEESQTELRARNSAILADRIRAALADLDRPVFGFDILRAARETIPEDDPLLDGMILYMDESLTFPFEYSGSPRWHGLESVAPGFADAAFEEPLNTIVGPVLSMYGWHVIVVEERIPPDLPPADEMRRIAEERTIREMQEQEFRARMDELLARIEVLTYEDAIQLLALPAEERLRQEAEARGERFR